jgi:hypothetical protein
MLLLTSDWPRYRHYHNYLLANLRIHPSSSGSSTHLFTVFLCLLADPLGFEDLPPGIPVAARNRCWLDIIAVTAYFLRCMCPTTSPLPPPLSPASPQVPLTLLLP